MTNDEALMLEFRRGSREAFEELFARYRDPLYRFFRRRVDGADRAQDLTQETFLAVLRGVARYEPRALVRTYLYGIALKLLAADRRRHRGETSAIVESSRSDPHDSTRWVREALDRLDAVDREILMLREYEELSYAELSALLSIPVNTVRSRLFRARMAMRDQLEAGGRKAEARDARQ